MINFAEVEMGKGLFGKALNKLPGVETQPLLIDQITGEPVPIVPGTGPNGLNPLMQAIPFFPRQSKADAVWDAVYDILGSYSQKSLDDALLPTSRSSSSSTLRWHA